PGPERFLAPVVDEQAPIDPEAIAIVSFDADAPDAAHGHAQCSGPPSGVPVERNTATWGVERPAEVYLGIGSRQAWRAGHPVVVEVFATEAGSEQFARHHHWRCGESSRARRVSDLRARARGAGESVEQR